MNKQSLAAAALCVASGGVFAADAGDLAAIRAQIADMKQSYEARIAALEEKLARAEARPVAEAASASNTAAVPSAPPSAGAGAFNPEVSLILQGQYRQMKDIPGRRLGGFFPSGAEGNDRRGFSADETELVLAANIDPYWRGQAIVAMADGQAEVEEAWIQSLGLGHGAGLRFGRFRSGIGYLNEQHPHARDFADAPLMYQALFGDSYAQDGVQLKWLAPLPLFVEFGAELGRGANFPGTDRNRNGAGATALFVHAGDDVGVAHSWRAGLSWLKTKAVERSADFTDLGGATAQGAFSGDSATWLADFVWKWAPDGNPAQRNFKLQGEYFVRTERGSLACTSDDAASLCATPLDSDYRTRQSGWYAQGVYQFTPNWRAGLRHERLAGGQRDFGANAANLAVDAHNPQKSSAMVDYSWSEFSRVRLQYAQDRSTPEQVDRQWTLQYIMSLGAHGAHKF